MGSRRLNLVLSAAFGFLLVAIVLTLLAVLRLADVNAAVAHAFEVRQAAREVMSALQDAESSQRGYLLTEDARYLEPYEAALASLPATLARLEALAETPEQLERVRSLAPPIAAKLEELAATVALAQGGRREEALDLVRSDLGETLMDSIRAGIDELSAAELEDLRERQATVARLGVLRLGLISLSFTAAILLSGGLALINARHLSRIGERTAELEREIQTREAAEATLRQAQKMEAIGHLSGGIAHDFNNLLTIVLGNLDAMRRRLDEPGESVSELAEKLARPLAAAQQGARSAAQLTHRLLAFARRQPLAPASVDLNRLIADISDLLRRTLGETVVMETVLAGGLWPTAVDPNQLENALVNLCVNGRDAMEGGGKLTIETANTYLDDAYTARFGDIAPGQYVVLCVTDTGSGMSPETLARVFEPFFTTKPLGSGTGLGLAMVHGFVKQSGGHVRIYSELGQGTTVKMYLPRLHAADQRASAPAPREAEGVAPPRAKPGETILAVEDNAGVRDYARTILEELGYAVLTAADAREAAPYIDGGARIDLLFTDVVLPGGVDGRKLAERARERRPGLPVLYTTGYTPNAIVHNGRLDAGVQLLSKPYAQQALAAKIRELIDKAKKGA